MTLNLDGSLAARTKAFTSQHHQVVPPKPTSLLSLDLVLVNLFSRFVLSPYRLKRVESLPFLARVLCLKIGSPRNLE